MSVGSITILCCFRAYSIPTRRAPKYILDGTFTMNSFFLDPIFKTLKQPFYCVPTYPDLFSAKRTPFFPFISLFESPPQRHSEVIVTLPPPFLFLCSQSVMKTFSYRSSLKNFLFSLSKESSNPFPVVLFDGPAFFCLLPRGPFFENFFPLSSRPPPSVKRF